MEKFWLNGIAVFPFGSEGEIIDYADKHKGILIAVNAEKTINASARLRQIINDNIGYCDGMGAVKAAQKKGFEKATRIPGCELWLKIIAAHQNASFYLIGTTDEIIAETVEKLRNEFPGINIVGYHNGFLKNDDEKSSLINDVAAKKPDFVFVAMGSPRQEYLMEELLQSHRAVYQGLGGSFDLYTGHFKRAPKFFQRINCEWLWRFVAQPARITRIGPYLRFAIRLYTNRL